jgi:2-oxoglutarate ferredoxin oxidoreductase subunit gamma
MDKFEKSVKPGGTLIYDGNGITRHPVRTDINIYRIDAADEAARQGLSKIFNMIVLGGYLKIKPIVKLENVILGLKKSLPDRYHHLIPENEKAIIIGMGLIQTVHQV